MKYTLILLVVCMISAGQILFKVIAKSMPSNFIVLDWLTFIFSPLTLGVLGLYGVTTFFWIYTLKLYPLSSAYPFMALSFVIVPIASFFLFQEKISVNLIMGSLLIVAGIIVAIR